VELISTEYIESKNQTRKSS